MANAVGTWTTVQSKRDEHQAELLRLEIERGKREAEDAKMRRQMHHEDIVEKKYAAYLAALKFDDEISKARAEKLKRELKELADL